jgi:transcriptional regulator with XRE-family HTH domain
MQGGTPPSSFWGKLIFQLRTEKDMSQRELALTAKVNRSTLRRIEEGTSSGDILMIEAVLSVLGYELEAMVHDENTPTQPRQMPQAPPPDTQDRSKLAAFRLSGMTVQQLKSIYA